MAMIPIENTGAHAKNIAGTTIPPGETRFFDESDLPAYLRKKVSAIIEPDADVNADTFIHDAFTEEMDQLSEMLALPVRDSTKRLHLISSANLDRLDAIEQSEQNRKTLINAITEERLRRADIENSDLTSVEKYIQIHRVGE